MSRFNQAVMLVAALFFLSNIATAQDISGEVTNPRKELADNANVRLIGPTTFGWLTGEFGGNIDLNGHQLKVETGGGNRTVFSGAIVGEGDLVWNGGGAPNLQTYPSFFAGKHPNLFRGTLTIERGTLAFAKPANVHAYAGKRIVLGGGSNQAILRLDADNQIDDQSSILIAGKHEGRIWTEGHSETVGTLALQSFGYLDLGNGKSEFRFADSSQVAWDPVKTFTIRNWTADQDTVYFGTSGNGLLPIQIARIGFENPSSQSTGLYSAKLLKDGQIVPDKKVVASDPPFDVSETGIERRRKIYEVNGRKKLAGPDTPLKDGMTVSFFGDSITWQNNFIKAIGADLSKARDGKGIDVQLVNRGINGGGVLSVRDGVEKSAFVNEQEQNGRQESFAQVIQSDRADVAVVFIGINDVWWRKTSPEDFEKALRDLVSTAEENKTQIVLATLSVYQERPDGSNPKDEKCDEYAELIRKVARTTGSALVDLRQVFMAYLQNHNSELRVDGSLNFRSTGILTYDGVHPNEVGNELLADHISDGIYRALQTDRGDPIATKSNVDKHAIKIDAILQARVVDGFSGVIVIRCGDQILLHKAYGLRDRESNEPMRIQHGFDIGSIVKPMTATAILKLQSQKKLLTSQRLDDFFNNVPSDKREITISQLLEHRSGLQDIFGGDYQLVDRESLINTVLASKLIAVPGQKKQYSNAGYSMLAAIIETVSGQPFEEFILEHIHRSARVRRIGYLHPEWKKQELAVGYDVTGKRWGTPLDKKWSSDGPSWNLRGNGGMLATAMELNTWYDALCAGNILDENALKKYFEFGAKKSKSTGSLVMGHAGGNDVFNSLQVSFVGADVHITFLTSDARQQAEMIWPEFSQEVNSIVKKQLELKNRSR